MRQQERNDAGGSVTSTLIERIDHVVLRVREIEPALGFYRDVAGLTVTEQTNTGASLAAPGSATIIELTSEGVDAPADRIGAGLYHTAIRYRDRKSLANALKRLVDAGYRIGASDHGVSEALYVDDPDGNGVELYRDRDREQWPHPAPGEKVGMTLDPLDLRTLLDEATDDTMSEGTDIGHVHLEVSNLERTIRFYTDALGLDLMARHGDQAGFFASNGYHHHLGANTWHSLGRPSAPKNHAGLERIVFRAGSQQQLLATRDRLLAQGHDSTSADERLVVHDPDGIELVLVTG